MPVAAMNATIDVAALHRQRNRRLREVMVRLDVPALLTPDPINVGYACGHRNMTVYGMMGPSRFALVIGDGPTILFEFAGCDHLSSQLAAVDEVRAATAITANSGASYRRPLAAFAAEVAAELRRYHRDDPRLAIEKVDFEFSDALRANRIVLLDAMSVLLEARRIKQPLELDAMREATARVEHSVAVLESHLHDGVAENEAWAAFHHDLIANDGEYVVARLFQSGSNTFPYFRECSDRRMSSGELACLDTDASGYLGYSVDFSRTFVCGGERPTARQRQLHDLARDQLTHNAALIAPGVSFEQFARNAWPVPERFAPYGYYCLAHGLGVAGEHPNVPLAIAGQPYDFPGDFEENMVVCVESYIGCDETAQGVKLEDQFLVTPNGVQAMSTYPFLAT